METTRNYTLSERSYFHLSNEVTVIFQWVIFTVLCQTIVIFGIVANIINVICFIKLGFKDPVNVSLLGLAISDLGCLVTLLWTNICFTPAFSVSNLPFDPTEFQYLTSGMPHTTFSRITGWITALITLERCLCITAPLKVKTIVTPRRVSITIISVYVILIASVAPLYVVNKLGLKFFPNRNKTLLGLVITSDRDHVERISFTINNVCIPFSSFIVIMICTITLVVKLNTNIKWRQRSAISTQADNTSSRNQKVAKMVVMISILFIASFIPVSILFMAMAMVPEMAIDGAYIGILIIIGGIGFLLESISSAMNIVIYYHMSSKYRTVFLLVCRVYNTRSLIDATSSK